MSTLVHPIQDGGISVVSENMFVHNNSKHGRKVRRGENGLVVEGATRLKVENSYSMHDNIAGPGGCKFSVVLSSVDLPPF